MLLAAVNERLCALNVGTSPIQEGWRHVRVHKPLLLMTGFDLMDRFLIASAPDRHWQVFPILDPRKSNGERELLGLAGKKLLLPQDQAFHPAGDGLEWRCKQLIA